MIERRTLATRLNSSRRARFVGRERELEQFRAALTGDEVTVLYLHGPGGVGKSTLLDAFEQLAREHGAAVVRIDARDIERSEYGLLRAFDPVSQHASAERLVLMLDTWELAASIDEWLRESYLPRLPHDALVVISSRTPPGPEWTIHPAWASLLRVIGLRNFSPEESTAYLLGQGIDAERHPELASLSYGHPLALSLLCVLDRQADELPAALTFRDQPNLVHALLHRCLDTLPEGDQRLALAVAAHARVTTEELLREVMQIDDAAPLFAWLRGLSIMQEGPFGIFPHDLARDVIDTDFRWRDLQGYVAMHARVRAPIIRRIRSLRGIEQQQAANDLLFLHRNGPVMGRIHHWATLGQGRAEPATPEDLPVILEMVERFEGGASAAIARYWWDQKQEAFVVFRGIADRVFGFSCHLLFAEPKAADSAVDPAIAGMWHAIEARNPLRPGEVALYSRFFMDRDAYQANSPGTNLMAMGCAIRWITIPNLAWSLLCPADPEQWGPVFTYLDHHALEDGSFQVGSRRYAVYGHDWRTKPVDPWLEMMGEREIASELPPVPERLDSGTVQVLSRPDFDQSVRRALRDLHNPTELAQNPLCHSRLVLGASESGELAAILRKRLLAAAALLVESPRDAKLARAIDRTYLRPAATQELAAESLGLPFNTYRYHLSSALRRISDHLWQIELGP
jgi:hypothetical protein